MEKPKRKECNCRPMIRCVCDGYNKACQDWEDWLDEADNKVPQETT